MKKLLPLLLLVGIPAAYADLNHSIMSTVKLEALSAATVGEVPNFSDITSSAAASVGTAAIGLDNHSITLTPGTGTGITLTGQFVTDLTID